MKKEIKNAMKGFTLIELLVVITIIGILATIVVVNLNSARGKGQDTAIKEQMSQIRAQAALYYDDNFGYTEEGEDVNAITTGTCPTNDKTFFSTTDFIRSADALKRNSGRDVKCYIEAGTANIAAQNWAVMTVLRSASSSAWCVDAVGNSQSVSTNYNPVSSGYACQ
jgi:prepilin-type N-terminal cleavage/methylation domain-containing protein